jgi:hypothetical protein
MTYFNHLWSLSVTSGSHTPRNFPRGFRSSQYLRFEVAIAGLGIQALSLLSSQPQQGQGGITESWNVDLKNELNTNLAAREVARRLSKFGRERKGVNFQNHIVDANHHPHSVYISRIDYVPMWKKPFKKQTLPLWNFEYGI